MNTVIRIAAILGVWALTVPILGTLVMFPEWFYRTLQPTLPSDMIHWLSAMAFFAFLFGFVAVFAIAIIATVSLVMWEPSPGRRFLRFDDESR